MKTCQYCKIDVGGDLKKCPFCQSAMTGTAEEAYFPEQSTLKLTSLFYKLQMFIVWTIVIVVLGIEFLGGKRIIPGMYVSLIVTMWLLAIEFGIMRLFKKGTSSSRAMTLLVFIVSILMLVTSYFFGFYQFMTEWILPCIIMVTMLANFVLALVDQISNAMVYLLANMFVGALPYIVLLVRGSKIPIAWVVSIIFSIVLFVGAIIFKGRAVISEIHRRFNL